MSQKPFESWTRTEENEEGTVYCKAKSRRRLRRGTLALLGIALILLSVGWVFADVQSVGDAGAATTPKSERLRLTIPKLKRVKDIPVYTGAAGDKGKLAGGTLHSEDTGFPWQKGANTYIAGHRVGYEGTHSYLVFYYLDQLVEDDEILLEDSAGTTYTYRVTDQLVVDPDNVEVMEPEEGKSLVSLQTCTLPDYKQRLIVQGELVARKTT